MQLEKIPRQVELWFFDPSTSGPTDEDRTWWADPSNPHNPFYNFIGNPTAVRRLCRAAKIAFSRYNRDCSDQAFAILGPASTGKTTLAKMFAKLIGLPFVEVDANACNTVTDIVIAINKALENIESHDEEFPTLELQELGDGKLVVPPCIVFIDEVHNLPKKVEQELLKATEWDDARLIAPGADGTSWDIDTSAICWLIATTDRGDLFSAFDTRFSKIHLNLYTKEEMAQIIQVHNPDWDLETCEIVARYAGRVPREALAFAREMRLESDALDDSWENIAARIAEDNHIDQFGMTYQRLSVLSALGHGPIARSNLGGVIGCKEAELTKFVMPPLLSATADQLPLVKITSKGYCLTQAGAKELEKRNIPFNSDAFGNTSLSTRLHKNQN
ncbi:MAG: AAA family ATPase [Crenarchaeota archaeon]|nr:MAG: AAA family ATPase [Thermoproteota archaeon]